MFVEVDNIFCSSQLSAMAEQVRIMSKIMDNMALRIDELQYEIDEAVRDKAFVTSFNDKIGLDTVDCACDCPDCQADRSYRMD